jgi:hypothetical protein
MDRFVTGLRMAERKVVMEVLKTIDSLCEQDIELGLTKEASFKYQIEIAGGLDELEQLQRNPNEQLSRTAFEILSKYFELENEDDEPEELDS